MLAARLPRILPDLAPDETLETTMIHSRARLIDAGGISRKRPFRAPHHTASMAAIVGGGKGAKPGEIRLAHNVVLFMDEFTEYPRGVLETPRQPIETGDVVVARANAHVKYPFKCGHMADPSRAYSRAPACGEDYMGRISGPLMDRFDLRVEVPRVSFQDLDLPPSGDGSSVVAGRVARARHVQMEQFAEVDGVRANSDLSGALQEEVATPDEEGRPLLNQAAERIGLSARGVHRVIRVARTIAVLENREDVGRSDIAEAISFRISGAQI